MAILGFGLAPLPPISTAAPQARASSFRLTSSSASAASTASATARQLEFASTPPAPASLVRLRTVRSSSALRDRSRSGVPTAFAGAVSTHDTHCRDLLPPPALQTTAVAPEFLLPADLALMPLTLRSQATSHARRRILCYGDSLTAGFYHGGRRFEPYARALLEKLTTAGVPCEVSFCGHNGRTAKEMLDAASSTLRDIVGLQGKGLLRILWENGPFDLVIIMAGTNDMGYGAYKEDILESLRGLHALCQKCGVPTLALAPPPAPCSGFAREAIRQWLVERLHNLARCTDGIVACVDPAGCLPTVEARLWDKDGLHFSPAGSRALGRCLATAMEHIPSAAHAPAWAKQRSSSPRRTAKVPMPILVAYPECTSVISGFRMSRVPTIACA